MSRAGWKGKSIQVREFIMEHIIDGRHAVGSAIPSERELAVRCGISRQTVRAGITELVNDGVLVRRQGKGTFVRTGQPADGGAAAPRTNEIGVLVPNIAPGYYANLVQNIGQHLSKHALHMLLTAYGAVPEHEAHCMAGMIEKGAAGLIVFPSYNSFTNQYYHNLKVHDVPFVLLDSPVQGVDADLVHVDNAASAYEGTKALIAAGCRRIAFLSGYMTAWTSRERLVGCQKALWEHGLALGHELVFEGAFHWRFGYNTAGRLFDRSGDRVDGFVVANHEITEGVIKAMHERHLRIPHDLRICTFEQANVPMHDIFPMVVVSQPAAKMAKAAVETLIERIAERNRGPARAPARHICFDGAVSVPACGRSRHDGRQVAPVGNRPSRVGGALKQRDE